MEENAVTDSTQVICELQDENHERTPTSQENKEPKKEIIYMRIACVVLGVLLVAAVVFATVLKFKCQKRDSDDTNSLRSCGEVDKGGDSNKDDILSESAKPILFEDLTTTEILHIRKYLENDPDIKIKKAGEGGLADSRLYSMELEPPTKADALAYLDGDGAVPERRARVVIFRGELTPPVIEERICSPLTDIKKCVVDITQPFFRRPVETLEYYAIKEYLIPEIQKQLEDLLRESYDASFDSENCVNCLNYWISPVGTNLYESDRRIVWLNAMYDLEYYSAHSLDLSLLIQVDGTNQTQFAVKQIWYSGRFYDSLEDLKSKYAAGSIPKTTVLPPKADENLFSTMHIRGDKKPHKNLRPPQLIEPDGPRYRIKNGVIDYLDMWKFHFRMSQTSGPQLYNIKMLGERVIYELSLSELAVDYSGKIPSHRQLQYIDSSLLTGGQAKVLVPGADCPLSSTYIPLTVASEDKEIPSTYNRVFCVFEQNSGAPLRRHHSYSDDDGAFYAGMVDSHLVVRSIHAIDNYDYVIDFTFHQSGAIGVSVSLTGYLLTSFWASYEQDFSFPIQKNIAGPLHFHCVNFKVDLDVNGESNRYETVEVQEETSSVEGTPSFISYTKKVHSLKKTEKEALFRYDFNKPTEHLFYNDEAKNAYGVNKAYRIVNHGQSKNLVKENLGNEKAIAWSRYQLAVTKHKEEEKRAGSVYAQYETKEKLPYDFETFHADDESIEDEDLVAWVTLAVHHIPHTEDLPVTSTPGKTLNFYIMPYNYYTECPSIGSKDAVRIDKKDSEKAKEGLLFEFHGTGDVTVKDNKKKSSCLYTPWDWVKVWKSKPHYVFET